MKTQTWPTIEEQMKYWETRDIGGNLIPSRVEANHDRYTTKELMDMEDERGEREVYRMEDAADDHSNPPEHTE